MSEDSRNLPLVHTVEDRQATARNLRIRIPKRIRNLELLLLFGAYGVNFGALALVRLGLNLDIPGWLIQLALIPTVATLALNIVLRFTAKDADPFIVPIATVLSGISTAMIHRIDL